MRLWLVSVLHIKMYNIGRVGGHNPPFLTPGPEETFQEVPEIYAEALVSKQWVCSRNSKDHI